MLGTSPSPVSKLAETQGSGSLRTKKTPRSKFEEYAKLQIQRIYKHPQPFKRLQSVLASRCTGKLEDQRKQQSNITKYDEDDTPAPNKGKSMLIRHKSNHSRLTANAFNPKGNCVLVREGLKYDTKKREAKASPQKPNNSIDVRPCTGVRKLKQITRVYNSKLPILQDKSISVRRSASKPKAIDENKSENKASFLMTAGKIESSPGDKSTKFNKYDNTFCSYNILQYRKEEEVIAQNADLLIGMINQIKQSIGDPHQPGPIMWELTDK